MRRGRGLLLASVLVPGLAVSAHAASEGAADVCLEVASNAVPADAWTRLTDEIGETIAARTALFPDPTTEIVVHEALLGAATPSLRLDIDSGRDSGRTPRPGAPCLEPGFDWSARFGRDFLDAGADQMLAEAPTTPGIDSSVDLGWHGDENRIRTTLDFAGPLSIPNGTCWIDDTLSIDVASGMAVASAEQGVETSIFAEGACGRFFDHLTNGGAGEQAVTLLPTEIELEGGRALHLVAEQVTVTPDAIIVGGSVEEG